MELKIAQLRKLKGVSQQELADYLGVTFQSVSKWETKSTLPDITFLPAIAEYFQVTVDEVLGLVPIHSVRYIPRNTDDREKWGNRDSIIKNDRHFFWNTDYLEHMIKEVWKIDKPINVIEFCCCDGDLGKRLMSILPAGSTYTGVDSEYLLESARANFCNENYQWSFIASDVYSFKPDQHYDMSICQAALRHMNHPLQILQLMKDSIKKNGLVVSIEINREIENVGFYLDGMDYDFLCTSFDWRRLWLRELESEGRDYAIGMRVPFYMKQIGLREVDVRMNDKVTFVTPEHKEYHNLCDSLAAFRGWNLKTKKPIHESVFDFYMSRGYKRSDVEKLFNFQEEMTECFEKKQDGLCFLQIFGFLISFGRK